MLTKKPTDHSSSSRKGESPDFLKVLINTIHPLSMTTKELCPGFILIVNVVIPVNQSKDYRSFRKMKSNVILLQQKKVFILPQLMFLHSQNPPLSDASASSTDFVCLSPA